MGVILAALPTLYPLIKTGIGDVVSLISYARSVRAAAQQTGEWTPAMEAQFLAEEIGHAGERPYQPDSQIAP